MVGESCDVVRVVGEVRVVETDGSGPEEQLATSEYQQGPECWSPDGRDVLFVTDRGADLNLMRKRADGSAPSELVLDLALPLQEAHYSATGDWLVYRTTPQDIYALSAEGDTVEIVATAFNERSPRLSPDGQWVAYMSNESNRMEVYVRPFPDAGQARWQVSTSGGGWPLWAPDSRTLYYGTQSGQVIAVAIVEGPTFIAGEQRVLFTSPEIIGGVGAWDIAPDGERFVVIRSRGLGGQGELVLVENITTELKERVR